MKPHKLTYIFLFLLAVNIHAQPLKYSTKAKAAILYNPDNGAILFEKEAHQLHHPASTLKIATVLFLLDQKQVDLDTKCVASKAALTVINAEAKHADFSLYPAHILEHDGTMAGLKPGKTYSYNSLIHGMLLQSGNDAANVIAEACSGSIEKFTEELNAYLQSKGFTKTRCDNPHGLHYPTQVTTAYELAQIAALGFKNPQFAKIIKSTSFAGDISIVNTNRLLKEGKYKYPKTLGGKTGYVAKAGYNLVTAAEENGRRLIAVLLGSPNSEERFKDAIALFEAAFREKKKERILFSKDHGSFHRTIPKADRPLKGRLDRDVVISYYPSEERELKARLQWNRVKLPISAGMEIGKLIVEDEGGNTYIETPLFSETGLKKSVLYQIIDLSKQLAIWGTILLFIVVAVKLFKKRPKIDK